MRLICAILIQLAKSVYKLSTSETNLYNSQRVGPICVYSQPMRLICTILSRLDQFVCTTNQWVSYSANMRPTSMLLLKRASYWRTEEVQPVKMISRRTSTPAALWMNDDENLQRSISSAQQHHSEQWIMVLLMMMITVRQQLQLVTDSYWWEVFQSFFLPMLA